MNELEMKQHIVAKVTECVSLAEETFNAIIPLPSVTFGLTGSTAGKFQWTVQYKEFPWGELQSMKDPKVNFNLQIALANIDTFDTTIYHEVAHYIVRFKYGKEPRPHGDRWKYTMILFGQDPNRCHKYKIPLSCRRRTPFRYECKCTEHFLSKIAHKKGSYSCNKCKGKLKFREKIKF